jgi:lipoate synthase
MVGQGEFSAQVKKVVLDLIDHRVNLGECGQVLRERRQTGPQEPQMAIEFIHIAHADKSGVVFRQTRSISHARAAVISGSGGNA